MNLSQFQQALGHGRGSDAGPGQAWDHGCEIVAPVEAVFELGEVAGHVFCADRAVGSGDGGLDVAEGGVDPFEDGGFRGSRSRAGFDDRVAASCPRDGGEAGEAVADHGRGGIEALFGDPDRHGACHTAFATLASGVGAVLSADRTLSGLCDWVEAEAPRPVGLPIEGAASLKAAVIPIVLHYSTADPLG